MNDDSSIRCRALQTLAAGPYLMMCEFPGDFAPLQARAQAAFGADDLSTWRPADTLYFTVMCVGDARHSVAAGVQLLYDHETTCTYYLRRDAWIQGCPKGTSLLAHFVEDRLAHGVQPSLLLFDVLRDSGESMRGVCPMRRYERLRAIAEGVNRCFMAVQWAGKYSAATQLVSANKNTQHVPHDILCEVLFCGMILVPFFALSDTQKCDAQLVLSPDPLHPSRPRLT